MHDNAHSPDSWLICDICSSASQRHFATVSTDEIPDMRAGMMNVTSQQIVGQIIKVFDHWGGVAKAGHMFSYLRQGPVGREGLNRVTSLAALTRKGRCTSANIAIRLAD